MKKIMTFIMAAFLSATAPMQVNAESKTSEIALRAGTTSSEEEAVTLLVRLDEIKAMDKSKMSVSEKKMLRKEVRGIKERLKDIEGGVYLSVGAIIIIVILLIILL